MLLDMAFGFIALSVICVIMYVIFSNGDLSALGPTRGRFAYSYFIAVILLVLAANVTHPLGENVFSAASIILTIWPDYLLIYNYIKARRKN